MSGKFQVRSLASPPLTLFSGLRINQITVRAAAPPPPPSHSPARGPAGAQVALEGAPFRQQAADAALHPALCPPNVPDARGADTLLLERMTAAERNLALIDVSEFIHQRTIDMDREWTCNSLQTLIRSLAGGSPPTPLTPSLPPIPSTLVNSIPRTSPGDGASEVNHYQRSAKNGDRSLLCGVISYDAPAHPSEHNGAVVSVLGLTTTGIDPALLSSLRVCMRGPVERWRERKEPANMTQVQAFGSGSPTEASLCVSLLSLPNLQSSHREATYCKLHASDQKNKKKKGFPSSQGNHDMKYCSCQGP
ncbi:hypothetical protein NQZ68_002630 [Dissostichus eleginoides]|nr:hypothetical protein NQZ68_002630 [Dissostichus eleginoides]